MIFTKAQWRSWLVKGAFIIAGYVLILALHFAASWFGSTAVQWWLMLPGIPLAALTAIYTAYLFAQAKARDLWQNPLLPPHLLIQALLLGSAVLMLAFLWFEDPMQSDAFLLGMVDTVRLELQYLHWIFVASSLLHMLMIWGEVSLTHSTAHARLAVWEMTRGRYKNFFWAGVALSVAGGALPLLAILGYVEASMGVAGAPLAMIGMMLYEHAYVQAGQSVPLA